MKGSKVKGRRWKVKGGRLEPKVVETEKVLNGLIRALRDVK